MFPFGKIFVLLSSLDLLSCNFSMIFAHFQTKRDITREAKTLQWEGGNIGAGGGGFGPYSLNVEKGPGTKRFSTSLHFEKILLVNNASDLLVSQPIKVLEYLKFTTAEIIPKNI